MSAQAEHGMLGDFRLLEVLGEGPSGRVFSAVHVPEGTLHAVKVLHEDLLSSGTLARLRDGLDTLQALDHRAVVNVQRLLVDGVRVAVVTDLVDGPDLGRFLAERGPLPPALACRIAGQVGLGLAAAHAAGVPHGSLTPENVVLEVYGNHLRARVTDFSVSSLVRGGPSTGSTPGDGARRSRAPELAAGAPATGAADVYALAALLAQAVGAHEGTDARDAGEGSSTEGPGPEPPAGLPPELSAVLREALSARPEDRPDARGLAVGLAQMAIDLKDVPAAPAPPPASPEPSRTEGPAAGDPTPGPPSGEDRPPRRLLLAAAAVTAVLAAGGALALVTDSGVRRGTGTAAELSSSTWASDVALDVPLTEERPRAAASRTPRSRAERASAPTRARSDEDKAAKKPAQRADRAPTRAAAVRAAPDRPAAARQLAAPRVQSRATAQAGTGRTGPGRVGSGPATGTRTTSPRPPGGATASPRPSVSATASPRPSVSATASPRPSSSATASPRPSASATASPEPASAPRPAPRPAAS